MKNYIVATDFSDNADNAVEHALRLARDEDAALVILHAFSLILSYTDSLSNAEISEMLVKEAEDKLDSLLKYCHAKYPGLNIQSVFVMGNAADEILRLSENLKASLVIIGLKGYGPGGKLIGQTARMVLTHAQCGVLAIPAGILYKIPEKIVLAYDNASQYSEHALDVLASIIGRYQAKLILLTVVPEDGRQAELPEKKKEISQLECDHQFIFEKNIDKAIIGFIEDNSPDLLVISPHRHNWLHRFISVSHAQNIASRIRIPVLCLKQ